MFLSPATTVLSMSLVGSGNFNDNVKVLETVTRYCNILKKSEAEKASLVVLGKFPQDALDMVGGGSIAVI